MRINTNETSFRAVNITSPALEVLSQRMPAGKFTLGLEEFKNKYKNSPVSLKIDTYGADTPRLDAIIYCKSGDKEELRHIMETKFSYFFNLNPAKFLKKAAIELEKMEKDFKVQ